MYHLYRLNGEWAFHEQTSYKKIRTPIPFILKRQYKILTFLYMSNNNSSANIIINSMIHHSKLSLKGNNSNQKKKKQTKTYQVAGKKLILVGGEFWGIEGMWAEWARCKVVWLHLHGDINVRNQWLKLELKCVCVCVEEFLTEFFIAWPSIALTFDKVF